MTAGIPRRCLDCRRLVQPDQAGRVSSRCAECTPLRAGQRRRRDPRQSYAWQRHRAAVIAAHPYCMVPGCGSTDRLEVDHLHPLASGGSLFGPTQVLCHPHHVDVTNRRRTQGGGGDDPSWQGVA